MRRIAAALGVLALTGWAAAPAGAVGPDYFPFPAGYTFPSFGVTADAAGDIWFGIVGPNHTNPTTMGQQPTPSLARLDPSLADPGTSDGIAFFPTPDDPNVNCCANQLRSLAYNTTDHKLYWVRNDGHLGSGDPSAFVPGTSTAMSTYRLPGNQDLWDVVAAKGAGVWFSERSASNVAPDYFGSRIAFSTGGAPAEGPNIAIQNGNTTINSLRYDAKPSGIAVDADGRPWFVEEDPGNPGYRIGSYGGTGTSYDEYSVAPCEGTAPCSGSYTGTGLTDLAVAPDGGIWFTNVINHKFGRFDPGSHQMTQYTMASLGLAGGDPRQMTAAPDGTIWMTSYQFNGGASSAIVQIFPPAHPGDTPVAQIYKTPGTTALGLAADHAGNIWFTTIGQGATQVVGRLPGVVGGAPPAGPGGDDPGGGNPGGGGSTTPTPAPAAPVATPVVPPPAATPSGPPIVLRPATTGTARVDPPQVGNGAINTNQICVGPPEARCSLVYLIKEHEYVAGFPSSVSKRRKRHQPRTLGTTTVTLRGGQTAKVTVKLNRLGKRILKGKHKLVVVFSATQKLANGKTKTVTKKTLTLRSR
jgi:streptogramin lyase